MAVLTNTMMQGTAAISDDDGYQIEKSLRFNNADQTNLERTPGTKGNTRAWTISVWVKRAMPDGADKFFMAGDTSDETGLRFDSDALHFYRYDHPSYAWQIKTNALFRDPSAWYHITAVYDSTNSVEADRLRLFVNGERQTSFSTASYPSQNTESTYNTAIKHNLGKLSNLNNTESFDGYLSDAHFIDGLALSPAAFGSFDSTGVWNPKTFALPAPNNGTTWSDNVTCNATLPASGADSAAEGFDGDSGTAYPNVTRMNTFTSSSHLTVSFGTDGIPCSQAVEIPYTLGSGSIIANYDVTFKDGHVERRSIKGPAGSGASGTFTYNGRGSNVTEFKITPGSSSGNGLGFGHIKIDGVELVDGLTDPATRTNPNNGITWSTYGTLTNYANAGNAFDGKVTPWSTNHTSDGTTMATGSANSAWTWDLGSDKKITGVETITLHIWPSSNQSGSNLVKINGTDVSADLLQYGEMWVWHEFSQFTEFEKLEIANNYWYLAGISINGHLLIDSSKDASFHLKFDDTSSNARLGRNAFNKGIADATGALPILNTTSGTADYDDGVVEGSGYRADSNAANLVFALPGNGAAGCIDVHHSISGTSGSQVEVANTGNSGFYDHTGYRFYGKSMRGNNRYAIVGGSGGTSSLALGGGAFTVESWVRPGNFTSNGCVACLGDDGSQNLSSGTVGMLFGYAASSTLQLFASSNGSSWNLASGVDMFNNLAPPHTGNWYHLAVSRDSSNNWYTHVNGIRTNTFSGSGTLTAVSNKYCIGANHNNQSQIMDGEIQDFRVYVGANKYGSADFIVPTKEDFTVGNLTEAAHGTVYDADGTWTGGAVNKNGDGMFNGIIDSGYYQPNHTVNTSDWAPVTAISGTTFKLYTTHGNSGLLKVNNTAVTSVNGGWTDISSAANGSLTSIKLGPSGAGSVWVRAWALEVDGVMITNQHGGTLDVLNDSPSNYTDSSGVVHGNYCTLSNALDKESNSGGSTFKEGNLYHYGSSSSGAWHKARCTMAIPKGDTGKWYYEVEVLAKGSNISYHIGWDDPFDHTIFAGGMGDAGYNSWCYKTWDGKKRHNNSDSTYGAAIDEGDILGLGYDNGSIYFWKNGTIQDSGTAAFTGVSAALCPTTSIYTESSAEGKLRLNFGQRPFKHPQSGYKGYCSHNMTDLFTGDQLNKPSSYFDIKTYTGNGASRSISGFDFGPDFVWLKPRSNTGGSEMWDQVRGATKIIYAHSSYYEETKTGGLTAFNSNGFSLGDGTGVGTNTDGHTQVAWAWDCGSAAATASTDGTITPSTQWVNATAGFSISKYTGNGTNNATIGHALGVKPGMVWIKRTDSGAQKNWINWIDGVTNTYVLHLNTDSGESQSNDGVINGDDLTNTIVKLTDGQNGGANHNVSGATYIMYAWSEINQYSSFGKYKGNGSADGSMVYCGFKPKYVWIKRLSAASPWSCFDSARSYNENNHVLELDANTAEATPTNRQVDLLANGFKHRATSSNTNSDGTSYIYCAFAEHPFKTARSN